MQAQSIDSSPENSSDSDDFYSGAAKRFKLAKAAKFTTGKVELIDSKPKGKSRKRSPSPTVMSDSSDEEIFRDVNCVTDVDIEEDNASDQETNSYQPQVETLEDVEDLIHVSPESSCYTVVDDKRAQSSSSAYVVEDEDIEEADPLAFQSLNESDLNHTLDDNEKVTVKVRLYSVVHRIEITRAQYFKTLIQELANKVSLDASKITLEFRDQILDPYGSLKTTPISITDIIEAAVVNEVIAAPAENLIELKVQSQARGSTHVISIRPEEPMSVLMQKYADAAGIELSKMTFRFDGDMLEEDDTPASLELEGGECIDVYIK